MLVVVEMAAAESFDQESLQKSIQSRFAELYSPPLAGYWQAWALAVAGLELAPYLSIAIKRKELLLFYILEKRKFKKNNTYIIDFLNLLLD